MSGDELGCGYRGVLSVPFDAALRDRIAAALSGGSANQTMLRWLREAPQYAPRPASYPRKR